MKTDDQQIINWRRPFINAKKLLFGKSIHGILSIGYIAFATRALGVTDFGILILIHSNVLFIRQLLGFQSWQMIMRYGADALKTRDQKLLRNISSFALKIEVIAALIGVLLIQILAFPILEFLKITTELVPMFRLYSILLIFLLVSDVGLGALRLFDRHDLISYNMVITATVRFIAAGLLLLFGAGLWAFLIAWLVSSIMGKVALLFTGLSEIAKKLKILSSQNDGGVDEDRWVESLEKYKRERWRFVIGTSLHSSLGVDVAPMLISSQLGPAGAGLWRIAQKFAGLVGQPVGKLLLPAVYTDMAQLSANGTNQQRRDMVMKTGLIAGTASMVLVLLMVLCGKTLLSTIAGIEFVDAYSTMIILTFSVVFGTFTFGVGPLLMTSGRVWQLTSIRFVTTAVFIIMIVPMVHTWGILGAGLAAAVRSALNVSLSLWVARDLLLEHVET